MATAGYYIPGESQLMQIRFLPGLHGYVGMFPRADHVSARICGELQHQSTTELRALPKECLRKFDIDFRGGTFYSHVLPVLSASSLRLTQVSEAGWAMIGDATGFVDAITGEGLSYALRSADLLRRTDRGTARFLPNLAEERDPSQLETERMIQFTTS